MNSPIPESAFAAQINVKMSPELKRSLEAIYDRHGVPPAELMRRLAQMAVSYEHGAHEMPVHGLRLVKREPLPKPGHDSESDQKAA
jgi:hypothetical protein